MKLLYYNVRQQGNVGSADTLISTSGSDLFSVNSSNGLITEIHIHGQTANNANDKRFQFIARQSPGGDLVFFDSGAHLNGLANKGFGLEVKFGPSGQFFRFAINDGSYDAMGSLPTTGFVTQYDLVLTGEDDDDLYINKIVTVEITANPEFPAGLL